MYRLGKKQTSGGPRPLLVGFRDENKKAELIKNLTKLKSAGDIHKNFSVAHDSTPHQREAIKKALAEAKRKADGRSDQTS